MVEEEVLGWVLMGSLKDQVEEWSEDQEVGTFHLIIHSSSSCNTSRSIHHLRPSRNRDLASFNIRSSIISIPSSCSCRCNNIITTIRVSTLNKIFPRYLETVILVYRNVIRSP